MPDEAATPGQTPPIESAMRTGQGDEDDAAEALTINDKLSDEEIENAPTDVAEAAAQLGADADAAG